MADDDSTAREQWLDEAEQLINKKAVSTADALTVSGLFAAAALVQLADECGQLSPLGDELRDLARDLVDEQREWHSWDSKTNEARSKGLREHYSKNPLSGDRAAFIAHYLDRIVLGDTDRKAAKNTRRKFAKIPASTATDWLRIARSTLPK